MPLQEGLYASDGYRTRYPPFPEELPTNWFKHHTFSHPSSNNTRFGASPFQCKVSATPQTQPYQGVPREDHVFGETFLRNIGNIRRFLLLEFIQ